MRRNLRWRQAALQGSQQAWTRYEENASLCGSSAGREDSAKSGGRRDGETLKGAIREEVDSRARIVTDENSAYRGIGLEYAGGHESVCHSTREYARGDVHTNTAESSFALVKRGIMGIYHNVSREHLHRYLWQFDFLWNNRKMNDGERTILAIRQSEGRRLMYKSPRDLTTR